MVRGGPLEFKSSVQFSLPRHERDEAIAEEFIRRSIVSCFSGTVIEVVDGLFHLLLRHRSEIRALRERNGVKSSYITLVYVIGSLFVI